MADLKIGRMTLGMVQTNCYFVYQKGKPQALVFDPADRGDYIYQVLKENGFEVAAILLTHGHFDHILGVTRLKELTGAKVYAYEKEAEICQEARLNLSGSGRDACSIIPDILFKDEEFFELGGIKGQVIATPGHTIGSCCYYFEEDKLLISGDTLFQESVGRSDFPTGSTSTLIRSICDRLMPLPEDVKVYPGHGDSTTIGYEKENNPFILYTERSTE